MKEAIGNVSATEGCPTTITSFTFWTKEDLKLSPFDIVKVRHLDESFTFGQIEEITYYQFFCVRSNIFFQICALYRCHIQHLEAPYLQSDPGGGENNQKELFDFDRTRHSGKAAQA